MSTSSWFWKMASATTGPGVTTCLFVRMSPLFASTTKPLAWLLPAASVSYANGVVVFSTTQAGTTTASARCHASSSSLFVVFTFVAVVAAAPASTVVVGTTSSGTTCASF